jgi:hypothetical protein
MWYKRNEQYYRIALFFSGASLAGAFGGILAYVGKPLPFIYQKLPRVPLTPSTGYRVHERRRRFERVAVDLHSRGPSDSRHLASRIPLRSQLPIHREILTEDERTYIRVRAELRY